MSLLDDIKDKALGAMKGETGGLMDGIHNMLASKESGGLAGIVDSFKEKGLGGIISSWISTGKNLPISADQIQQALGTEKIQQLAEKAGMSLEDVKAKLAEYLPNIIDKLTPDGKVPEPGLLQKGLDFLKSKM